MDYLSYLPVELWQSIVRHCFLMAVDTPPMNPARYTRLDHRLMDPRGRQLPNDVWSRLRLVCRAFHRLAGEYRDTVSPDTFITKYSPLSETTNHSNDIARETTVWCGPLTQLITEMQRLREMKIVFINLQTIYAWDRGEVQRNTTESFWSTLGHVFPGLQSLFIDSWRASYCHKLSLGRIKSKENVVLAQLRNLWMPSVIVFNFPTFPRLRYCALYTFDLWEEIYDRAPQLKALDVSGHPLTQSIHPSPPTLQSVKCRLEDVAHLRHVNLWRSIPLETLVLVVPANFDQQPYASLELQRFLDKVASYVAQAAQICPGTEIRLVIIDHSEEWQHHIFNSCLSRGLDVRTTPPISKSQVPNEVVKVNAAASRQAGAPRQSKIFLNIGRWFRGGKGEVNQ